MAEKTAAWWVEQMGGRAGEDLVVLLVVEWAARMTEEQSEWLCLWEYLRWLEILRLPDSL
jgi:hypothetical protein